MERGGRKPLHIFLTPASHDGLRIWCKANGVDVTAFIEALGLQLAERDRPGPFRATLEEARAIHARQHSRKPR